MVMKSSDMNLNGRQKTAVKKQGWKKHKKIKICLDRWQFFNWLADDSSFTVETDDSFLSV